MLLLSSLLRRTFSFLSPSCNYFWSLSHRLDRCCTDLCGDEESMTPHRWGSVVMIFTCCGVPVNNVQVVWSMSWYRWWCLRIVVVEDQLHSRLCSWKHLECILITYSVAHMEWNFVEVYMCIELCHMSTRSLRGGEFNFCDVEGYLSRVDLESTLKIPSICECSWRIALSQICHTH